MEKLPSINSYSPEHSSQRQQNNSHKSFSPATPETPRAQRPNFLQISDKEYFGAASSSNSSQGSSHSSQHRVTSVSDVAEANKQTAKHNNSRDISASTVSTATSQCDSRNAHPPLHRLTQQPTSFESTDPVETGCRGLNSNTRHDVTSDYYLSEEEELAMIAQQTKHSDMRWGQT